MERSKHNAHEQEKIHTQTCTVDEMIDRIYQGKSLPQDRRFEPTDRGGVFKYFYVGELVEVFSKPKYYPMIEVNGLVVGLAKLQQNPYKPNMFWISFVSVDPKYQGKGYASLLVDELFRFARSKNMTIKTSSYSDQGFEKLKPLFHKYAAIHGVPFIDTDERI